MLNCLRTYPKRGTVRWNENVDVWVVFITGWRGWKINSPCLLPCLSMCSPWQWRQTSFQPTPAICTSIGVPVSWQSLRFGWTATSCPMRWSLQAYLCLGLSETPTLPWRQCLFPHQGRVVPGSCGESAPVYPCDFPAIAQSSKIWLQQQYNVMPFCS